MVMSSKMPPVAAFRLLADLNEFMAHSPEERQSILDQWVDALDRRTPMLEALETDRDAAAADRVKAAEALNEAQQELAAKIQAGAERAKEIVATATSQAESINWTVADNVAMAKVNADTAAREAEERQTLEAKAFGDREDAVKLSEDAVTVREATAETLHAEAQNTKDEYEALIEGINALQRRAPR